MTAGTGSYGTLAWGPGTAYPVAKLEGARDMPALRNRDVPFGDRHGSATQRDYAEPRQLVLTLGIRGADHADLEALSEAVRNATPPTQAVQQLLVRDGTRMYLAKPRRRALPEDSEHLWRLGEAIIAFDCPDPREYEAQARTATLLLPSASTGFSLPLAFPFGFGAGGIGGDTQLVNPGNVPTPLQAVINGPVTNPRVAVNGAELVLTITLAAGEFLAIDTEARTVLLNGTASRRSAVVAGSAWPLIPPGPSTLSYRASSTTDPAATLVPTWRGAWL